MPHPIPGDWIEVNNFLVILKYIIPLKEVDAIFFKQNFKFSPEDALCQVWLKLALSRQTVGHTYAGKKVTRKAYLSFTKSSWLKRSFILNHNLAFSIFISRKWNITYDEL